MLGLAGQRVAGDLTRSDIFLGCEGFRVLGFKALGFRSLGASCLVGRLSLGATGQRAQGGVSARRLRIH